MGKNTPVPDPTRNVLRTVKIESRRLREMLDLQIKRSDDLRTQENFNVQEQMKARWESLRELRTAEAARIDSIRAVDVAAVASAALVSATQTTTLAGQVSAAADAMRAQQAATAQASQEGLTQALRPLQAAIDDLRRSQYEAQGQKTQIVETHAKSSNVGLIVGIVVGLFSTTIGSLMLGLALWVAAHKK